MIRVDERTVKLASSQENAVAGVAVALTSKGTGSAHSLTALNVGGGVRFNPRDESVANSQLTFNALHGLQTGDPVIYRNGGGSNIGGLTNGATYYAIRVDERTVKLATSAAAAQAGNFVTLTSEGSGTNHSVTPIDVAKSSVFTASGSTVVDDKIIFSADHGLKSGDEVVYRNGGGSNIGGLTDGAVYYAIRVDAKTIKLATTPANGYDGVSIALTSTGSGSAQSITPTVAARDQHFDPKRATVENNKINFPSAHGLNTGDEVVYSSGEQTAIGGLTNGATYYVIKVDDGSVRLATTKANAQNGSAITISANGSTGEGHALIPVPTAAAKTFASASAVSTSRALENTISFSSPHGLKTGDAIVYRNGDNSSIGGLTDGETYYVVKVDDTHVRLAATLADAQNAVPRVVNFTSATGAGHKLDVKTSKFNLGLITVPLPQAIGGQITTVTAAGGGGQSAGGAGAIGLNFVRMNVDAHISDTPANKSVTAAGNVGVRAHDTSHINSGVGSIGVSTQGGAAINASVGVNDIRNNVKAHIDAANVQSTGGSLTVSADETARIINVAVGGAGSSQGVTFGGSFAINFIKNNVDARISQGSTISASNNVSVLAKDTASIATLAGNINITIQGAAGVGVAFAVNEVNDTVRAIVDNSTVAALSGDLTVSADFGKPTSLPAGLDAQIAAMAVSGGAGQNIGGAGSVSLNWVRNTVEAKIQNVAESLDGDEIRAGDKLSVTAKDSSTINSLAGAVALAGIGAQSGSGAIGASIAYNYLGGDPNNPTSTNNNVVRATIENVAGTIRAGEAEVASTYLGEINNITVAGAAAGNFALGGSVSINFIRNVADAHVDNVAGLTTTSGGLRLAASDTSTVNVLAGGIGIAVSKDPVAIAAGVSVAENRIENTIKAFANNALISTVGDVEITAESLPTLRALTIGVAVAVQAGSGGFGGSGAGAGSGNQIKNTIAAYISNSGAAASKSVIFLRRRSEGEGK